MIERPSISKSFFDDLEDKVFRSYGVLDCCVFQNPKQEEQDQFVFVVIDPRRNRQQVIESIRLDSAAWIERPDGFRVIREVGGLPGARGTKARRDQCAAFILELARKRGEVKPQGR